MAGQATTLSDGLEQMEQNVPSIVVVDVNGNAETLTTLMDGLDGVAPKPRVVVLTDSFCLSSLTMALGQGVDGYLLKSMSPGAFEQSLNLVMMGEKVFPTDLAHLLINNRFVARSEGADGGKGNGDCLSDRESEILSCLVNGNSNKCIANSLNLTEGTVKVHLKTILKKIHVRNRTQAAIWALQNGIVADTVNDRSSSPRSLELASNLNQ